MSTYKSFGRLAYHPRMLLKVVFYDYMNNIYSCCKITKMGNVANQYTFVWKGT